MNSTALPIYRSADASVSPLKDYIAVPFELALLVFHVTVTFFIAEKAYRRATPYNNAFFKLYLIQCASNYMSFVTLLYQRLNIPKVSSFACQVVFNTMYQYAQYFQLATHTAITVNRWTAIVKPVHHKTFWEKRYFRLSLGLQLTLPGVLALVRPTLAAYYVWSWSIPYADAFGEAGFFRSALLAAVNFLVTAINLYLEAWSCRVYRNMDLSRKRQNYENFRLLLFTMLELSVQLLKVVYYAINTANLATFFLNQVVFYLSSLQVLLTPIFLLIISKFIRRNYLVFYGLSNGMNPVVRISATR